MPHPQESRHGEGDQERRDRPIDPAFVTARVNTADELNDADPAIHSNSVHQSIVDTNPTSSGTGELAASLTAPVGGQQLTLTRISRLTRLDRVLDCPAYRAARMKGLATPPAHRD